MKKWYRTERSSVDRFSSIHFSRRSNLNGYINNWMVRVLLWCLTCLIIKYNRSSNNVVLKKSYIGNSNWQNVNLRLQHTRTLVLFAIGGGMLGGWQYLYLQDLL